jgi:hypothetical protein
LSCDGGSQHGEWDAGKSELHGGCLGEEVVSVCFQSPDFATYRCV